MSYLTEEQLFKQAPSVFSTIAHGKTSEKYALIPTIESVRGLQKAGFHVVKAQESRCRDMTNKPYAKHMLRLRHETCMKVNDEFPEIVLTNSHNGLSSYQLRAGIYRLVCTNGLVVGNDLFYRSVRHKGDVTSKVVQGAQEIIEIMPKAMDIINEWKGITLNAEVRHVYAESAMLLKWDEDKAPINAIKLLNVHRTEDSLPDLWTTFNVLQENIIRGGIRYHNPLTFTRGRTREVTSVNENARLNTALWNLTERMALLAK